MNMCLRFVSDKGVLVGGDLHLLEDLVDLGACEIVGADIPHQKVVVGAVRNELLSAFHECCSKCLRIRNDLLRVVTELLSCYLLELHSSGSDLGVVGTSLQHRENSEVNSLLVFLVEENECRARASQTLVCGCGHDVDILER